jgi:hypothetical protein
VLLLVVSKESLASDHVKPEWTGALKRKKRIILLIFEAVLPPEEGCEWWIFGHDKVALQLLNVGKSAR